MTKKTKSSNETKIMCPTCGTQFAIPEQSSIAIGIVVGKDAGLGTITPPVASEAPAGRAKERIEALRVAGVNVDNLFAIQGANGGEFIASNKDGKLSILDDNDPIFAYISEKGTVPNRRLFRRWVMAQMFYMMSARDYRTRQLIGVTGMIHKLGYEYQWKMFVNELRAQVKMHKNDPENFEDRNRWFNQKVAVALAADYIDKLRKVIDNYPTKHCKGLPYKTIKGEHVFVADLNKKIFGPLTHALYRIKRADRIEFLYNAVFSFNLMRIELPWTTPQCSQWIDAYKGTGAYFTLQNMIRFHGCVIINDAGMPLNKALSLLFIREKAIMYQNGEGWRMLAVLKKCLDDNRVDIVKKRAEWRKR